MRWRDVKQNKTTQKQDAKTTELTFNYASHMDRIKAFITDSFLLAMPIFYIVIYVVMGDREGFAEHMALGWAYILIPLGLVVTIFYAKTGQTPGMKAYEIKVLENKTHHKPTFLTALLRFVFFNLVFFTVVGLLVPFFREDRRGLHDILSGTSIVKA
jgi:uncharacterized RDD family membrane protein YckC